MKSRSNQPFEQYNYAQRKIIVTEISEKREKNPDPNSPIKFIPSTTEKRVTILLAGDGVEIIPFTAPIDSAVQVDDQVEIIRGFVSEYGDKRGSGDILTSGKCSGFTVVKNDFFEFQEESE